VPIKFDIATLNALLMAAWRRRYLIVAPFAILPILGLMVGLIAPRFYETRMSILVQEIANNPVVQDLAVQTNLKDRMDGLSVLLQSRHILWDVVDSLHLVPQDATDAQRELKVQELSKDLSARLIGKDLIELKMRAREPGQMTQILETSAIRFIEAIRAPGQSEVASSEVFLQDKIKEQKAVLDHAETALADFRNTHSDQVPELHTVNAARLEQLKDALQQKKTELAGAEATGQTLRARLAQANPIIGKIEEQIVQISGELALLRSKYTDEHSAVQGALRQLERLQEERSRQIAAAQTLSSADLEQLWNLAASMPATGGAPADPNAAAGSSPQQAMPAGQPLLISQLSQLQTAEAKVNGLTREIASLSGDIESLQTKNDAFGDVEQMMTTLERDAKIQQDIYDSLLKRYEMARMTVDLGKFELPEAIKVIDRPGLPVTVNLPLILFFLAGIIGAAALGGTMAFVAELLDSSIRSVAQLERLVKAPVLSTIPMLLADGFTEEGGLDLEIGPANSTRGAVA
jgi:polysaccharide chain length determinant protein (PEP-CTERM system associated)